MWLKVFSALALLATAASQKEINDVQEQPKQNEEPKPQMYIARRLNEVQDENVESVPLEVKQFFARQQFVPELYGLTYLQPQYQNQRPLERLQPQIVLYGPGGQGQPILINPGNPPGNFLIPQGPGPNVIVRNNPVGPGFPVAGYPKPAHVPPIEKDAEEVPTNPAKIPPLQTGQPANKPKTKPEKLETFTETNQPEQNTKISGLPQLNPGQRFFVLNGDNIYNYPYEASQPIQDLPAFRYTNAQPFPQNPPKFVQPFAQEPLQYVQDSGSPKISISVPDILLRNSFVNSEQEKSRVKSFEAGQQSGKERAVFRTAQQYFRTGQAPNQLSFPENTQTYFAELQEGIGGQIQGLDASKQTVQPQIVGQFRFTPNAGQDFHSYRDDLENDAIVVDATFDAPQSSFDGRDILRDDETANSTPAANPPAENEPEPSMAQAGPQATAIAGPGGVAGAAPRGTAIVGKAGLAISSPQATAVAGTKEEEKKKTTTNKE